jgi:hypothetical protein
MEKIISKLKQEGGKERREVAWAGYLTTLSALQRRW